MVKKTRFTFRTTDEFKERLAKIAGRLNIDQSLIAGAALEALVDYVERHGELTIPVRIAETEGQYEKKKPAPKTRKLKKTA